MKHERTVFKELVDTTDITCDICGKTCGSDYGFEYMNLNASWGYMSGKDLETWEAQVCESCVDEHFKNIKFKKTSSISGGEI